LIGEFREVGSFDWMLCTILNWVILTVLWKTNQCQKFWWQKFRRFRRR